MKRFSFAWQNKAFSKVLNSFLMIQNFKMALTAVGIIYIESFES